MADETKKDTVPAETKEQAAQRDAEFKQQMEESFKTLGQDGTLERSKIKKKLDVFKILKGDNKNTRFLAPQVSVESLDSDLKWFGPTYVVDILNTYLRRSFQVEWLKAIDPNTGLLNLQQFMVEGADFTSAAMKIADIEEKIDELQELSRELLESGDIGQNPDGTDKPDLAQLRVYQNSIRDYKAMKEKKSNRGKEANAEASVQVK